MQTFHLFVGQFRCTKNDHRNHRDVCSGDIAGPASGLQRLGFSNGQPNATNLPFSDGLYHPLRDFGIVYGIGFTTLCPVKFGVRACIPDSFTFLFDKLQGHFDIQMQDLPPAKRPVEDEEEDEPQAAAPISIPLRLLSCFSELADIGKRS